MVESVICFVLICIFSVNSLVDIKEPVIEPLIEPKINAVSLECGESTGLAIVQIEAAISDKDINKMSSCFFKCYLSNFRVITRVAEKDVLNIPAMLIFVKMYIPEIPFIDLLTVAGEVLACSRDFETSELTDDDPDCSKTNELIECLSTKKLLIEAFWLATRN